MLAPVAEERAPITAVPVVAHQIVTTVDLEAVVVAGVVGAKAPKAPKAQGRLKVNPTAVKPTGVLTVLAAARGPEARALRESNLVPLESKLEIAPIPVRHRA